MILFVFEYINLPSPIFLPIFMQSSASVPI